MALTTSRLLVVLGILIVLAGCVTPTVYTWKEYDNKLYNYYQNPTDPESFIKDLREIISEGEKSNKVPPGLYAELGYALYAQGSYQESITYFQKESEKWIESKVLMAKMIDNANKALQRK
jgi:hypothetical protein